MKVAPSGSQNEFGSTDLPLLPGLRREITARSSLIIHTPDWCPRGHDVRDGGGGSSWITALQHHDLTCWTCRGERLRPDTWLLVDPALHRPASEATGVGLELVVIAPAVPHAPGRIELRVEGRPRAAVMLALCGEDRTGVIEHVAVDEPYRRLGYGRTLVLAALSRGRGYTWSTTIVRDTEEARGFATWLPIRRVGEPLYCRHMLDAQAAIP